MSFDEKKATLLSAMQTEAAGVHAVAALADDEGD